MKSNGLRTLAGFVAAWATTVAVAFAAGGLYAIWLMRHHAVEQTQAAVFGPKDALDAFLFFVGTTAAVTASVIGLLTILVVAWPIYPLSRRRQWVSWPQYVTAGLALAIGVAVVLSGLQLAFSPLVDSGYYLEVVAVLIAGPSAALVFWSVVRPDRFTQAKGG